MKFPNIFKSKEKRNRIQNDTNIVSAESRMIKSEIQDKGLDAVRNTSNSLAIDFVQSYNNNILYRRRKKDKLLNVQQDFFLYRMEKYWELDSIIFRAVNKLNEFIVKTGFNIYTDGDNKELDKFLTHFKKFLKLGDVQYTINSFIRQISHLFTLYGNAPFQHKLTKIGSGYQYSPIQFIDPLSVEALLDKDNVYIYKYIINNYVRKRGDLEKHLTKNTVNYKYFSSYIQQVPNILYRPYRRKKNYKELNPEDLTIIKYLNLHQSLMSMPPAYVALNDLVPLRAIEDDITLNSFQYGNPLLHVAVKYQDLTDQEIDQETRRVRDAVENMEGNGALVTSDRVTVKLVGSTGQTPDLAKYHEIFRNRTEKGIGVPDILTGEGGGVGRQTSETVEMSFYNYISYMGTQIEDALQLFIDNYYWRNYRKIPSNKESLLAEPSPIRIEFNEANVNAKRANEQHVITLYQANLITHDEASKRIGVKIDPKLKGKYNHEIGSSDTNKLQSKMLSQTSPTNQHGNQTRGTKKN